MPILAFIVAGVAAVVFAGESLRSSRKGAGPNWVAIGLLLFTVAFVLTFIIRGDSNVVTWNWGD